MISGELVTEGGVKLATTGVVRTGLIMELVFINEQQLESLAEKLVDRIGSEGGVGV